MTSFAGTPESPTASERSSSAQELGQRLNWVIGIRWTVVIALLLVGLFGSLVHIALAAVVATYNLIYFLALRRGDLDNAPTANLFRLAQVPLDLIIFTLIIHFSGSVTGPVFVLYFLYIFVGLAILPPAGAYVVALIAAACYGILVLVEALGVAPTQSIIDTGVSAASSPATYVGYFLTVAATLMITAYIANYFANLLTRDESTIREQLGEINKLYEFIRSISTTLSSDEVTRTLVATAKRMEGAETCSLLMLNEVGDALLAQSEGSPQLFATERGRLLPMDQRIARELFLNRKGLYAPDVGSVTGLGPVLARKATRSFYAIPILSEGPESSGGQGPLGSLVLSFDRKYLIPQSRWNLLGTMAQQAALAMERTRLFGDAQRSAREMAGLYHIGLATTSSLQIDEVLHLIYEQVNRVVHPDTFYIALYDDDLMELTYDLFIEGGQALPPFRARLDNTGVSGWVVRNRKPIFVRHWDMEIEQLPFEANVVGSPTQSVISVPLIAKNKIVGVMSVQAVDAYRFDQNHLRLLTSIAGQAALALENAKLHATVFEQAQRDPLTGAYNHGTFIDKLSATLQDAQAEKQAVALIMLDIDRFKQYNDTYGHLVGDDVLRSTVGAIQNHLKSSDIVGRWGGEEFGIVLPNVNRTQAKLVAERIRQTVSLNVMKDMHNRSIPSPTVSQGIAMYPEDATGIEELIDKADAALFRAKDMGRNQIAEWIDFNADSGPLALRAAGQ